MSLAARAPVQEALHPGTDAIRRGEIEIGRYRRGWLVRYKPLNGMVTARYFLDVYEAHSHFILCVNDLRHRLGAGEGRGPGGGAG